MAKTTTQKSAVKKTASNSQVTLRQCESAIKSMVASSAAFAIDADTAAIMALKLATHDMGHGDTSGIKKLHTALGDTGTRIGPRRQRALIAWLNAFSPVRLNTKTGEFGLLKKTFGKGDDVRPNPRYVAFDVDTASTLSFLEYDSGAERTTPKLTSEKLAARAGRLITKTLNDAMESGNFEGEYDSEMVLGALRQAIADFTPPTPTDTTDVTATE